VVAKTAAVDFLCASEVSHQNRITHFCESMRRFNRIRVLIWVCLLSAVTLLALLLVRSPKTLWYSPPQYTGCSNSLQDDRGQLLCSLSLSSAGPSATCLKIET